MVAVWRVSDLNPTKTFFRAFPFKAVRNAGGAQCEKRKQAAVWEHDLDLNRYCSETLLIMKPTAPGH